MHKAIIFSFITIYFLYSCKKIEGCTDPDAVNYNSKATKDDNSCIYFQGGTPYELKIPVLFSQYLIPPHIPKNNPTTIEGVQLGRKLFYDPILSGNNTQSCASCHNQTSGFSDNGNQFSTGIDGFQGSRNSMPIFNLAWNSDTNFFWDGRSKGLEEQVLSPVINPIEMHDKWPNVANKLQNSNDYPLLFYKAFGTVIIDSILVSKAISQFERTLISGNSKLDKRLRNEVVLSPEEESGYDLFKTEDGADCFHCHGDPYNPLWTDNKFHNNGLDAVFADNGLGDITGNPADNGKFRTPSLRNLIFTAPYMHDGRFATLDEVITFYSTGLQHSSTIDPNMKKVAQGGVQLTPLEMNHLKAFLLTLTDSSFITNTEFSQP